MISKDSKIYIASHKGMVGSACWRALSSEGYTNLIGKTSKELDLKDQTAVENFICSEKPDAIIDAAARVGGILANDTYPYEFLMDNMLIQNNLIRSAHENDIEKFIFLGSSCIYPKHVKQPLKEEYLLTGPLEPTNEWYAIAKISGVKLIQAIRKQFGRDYVSLMPTNLYGPNDNFSENDSHVIPGLIHKMHKAKLNDENIFKIWGSGTPLREFLFVDDLSSAVEFIIENDVSIDLLNVGSGDEISILDLANKIKNVIGFEGKIELDKSKPDGNPRKLLDSSKLNKLGWQSETTLVEGLTKTYNWYQENFN